MHQANVFHDSLSLMFSVQVSSSGATKHSKGFLSRAGRQQQDPTLLKGRISKATEKSVRSLANPLRRPKALCKIHPLWYRGKTLVLDSSLRSIPHLALGTQHFCAWSLLFNFVIQLVQPGEYSWGAHTLQSSLDGGNRKSCSPWRGDALGSSKHSFKNCLVQESLGKWYDPGSSCFLLRHCCEAQTGPSTRPAVCCTGRVWACLRWKEFHKEMRALPRNPSGHVLRVEWMPGLEEQQPIWPSQSEETLSSLSVGAKSTLLKPEIPLYDLHASVMLELWPYTAVTIH